VALVWYELHRDRRAAAERERQIKSWNHGKKQRLAEGYPEFQGLGTRVWVSLGQRSGQAPPLDCTIASGQEAMSRASEVSRGTAFPDPP
jgi:hypothetical protein